MATDFTIHDVLAWARTKPADERYNYNNPHNCALCQFLRETGRAKNPGVSPRFGCGEKELHSRRPYDRSMEPALQFGRTFGGLVARLEALIPAEPVSDTWTKADAYLTDLEMARS